MASDEARREVRSILRRLRAHGRRLPLLDAEWTVEEEHHWWCEVRPQFVLDHLREPWTVSEDDRRCWTPAACDAHYATVQWRIWNIGTVLLQYPVLTSIERQLDFAAFEPRYEEFFEAWSSSADDDDECWLPDELIGPWLEAFGNHPPHTLAPEGRLP